jgi:hypothetical protein
VLPDVLFSDQKSQFGYILEDLGIENVVIYSAHLEYFTTIRYILWTFGNFIAILVYFFPLWYIVSRKSGNPGLNRFVDTSSPLIISTVADQGCQMVYFQTKNPNLGKL